MTTYSEETRSLAVYEPFADAMKRLVDCIEADHAGKEPRLLALELNEILLDVAVRGLRFDYGGELTGDGFDKRLYDVDPRISEAHAARLIEALKPLIDATLATLDSQAYPIAFCRERESIHSLDISLARLHELLKPASAMWELGTLPAQTRACWDWRYLKSEWHEYLYRPLAGLSFIRFNDSENGIDDDTTSEATRRFYAH